MDDYTYGGTSLTFIPQNPDITVTEPEPDQPSPSRAKRFFQRFIQQCAVCAVLLVILLLINLFNNNFFNNINQRINHEITTNIDLTNNTFITNIFETARNFFTTSPPNEPLDPAPTNNQPNDTETAADPTPPAVSTDNISIDPELLDTINNR